MSRTCCSICKFNYDPENYAEVAHHNSLCSMMARGMLLEKKIEDEKKKFKALHQKESHRSKRTVREFRLPLASAGAYSSSILCGITSDELSTSKNSTSIDPVHLKSRFSSTKRRKLIDDLNKEKIHNVKGSNLNDKEWLQLDSEYEIAIIPNGKSIISSKEQNDSCSKSSQVFPSVNAIDETLLTSKDGVSTVTFGNDTVIPLRNECVLENDFVEGNEDDFANTQEGNVHCNMNDARRVCSHDLGNFVNLERHPGINAEANTALARLSSTKSCLNEIAHRNKVNSGVIVHSSREVQHLNLAHILTESNAPTGMYDKIIKWAKGIDEGDLDRTISFHTLIQQTATKYGLGNIFPQSFQVILPSLNAVKVTKFNFAEQLYSILSDDKLMMPDNLIYGEDIFRREDKPGRDHEYGEINTGNWWRRTQRSMCRNASDVLCPIIIYIDTTHVKSKAAEALSFTVGLFKSSTRNNPRAWRNLGMIPGKLKDLIPQGKYKQTEKGEIHLNDWHHVCKVLLSDFKKVQEQDGIDFELFGKKCILRIPIMFIIGDIEGHDKICSRKKGHSKMMTGVTHSCKVKRHECGNPRTECDYIYENEILSKQRICQSSTSTENSRKEAKEELDELGFYSSVVNAFSTLDYGITNFGVHGAVGICGLHTIKQKFPNDVLGFYFQSFGNSLQTKSAMTIDNAITRLVVHCLRQSERNLPLLTSFKLSFFKPKYTLSANEKYARIFALYLFCMTSVGWDYGMKKMKTAKRKEILTKRVHLIEMTLTIYTFLYQDKFHIRNKNVGQNEVTNYLTLYKEVAEWKDDDPRSNNRRVMEELESSDDESSDDDNMFHLGDSQSDILANDECTFPKFHYLKHIIDQIVAFGSAKNFDGGCSESNHKYLTKKPGSRTQGRIDTFDEQTSYNLCAKIVLDRAFDGIQRNHEQKQNDSNVSTHVNICKHKCATSFTLTVDGDSCKANWMSSKKDDVPNEKGSHPENVLKYIKHVCMDGGVTSLNCFTTLNWNNEIIRAHPCYNKKEWYDFVEIKWKGIRGRNEEYDYFCPSKVYMFIDFENHPLYGDGIYAIIHSTAFDERRKSPHQSALRAWEKRGKPSLCTIWTMEDDDNLHCLSVSAIQSTSYVIPDFVDHEMTETNDFVIQIKPTESWADVHNITTY